MTRQVKAPHLPGTGSRRAGRLVVGVVLLVALVFLVSPVKRAIEGRIKNRSTQAFTILPGQSVGPIELGMPREDLLRVLGIPDREEDGTHFYQSRGLEVFVGQGKVRVIFSHEESRKNLWGKALWGVMRFVRPDKVRGEFSWMPRYKMFRGKTQEGIGIGSTPDDVHLVFGEAMIFGGGGLDTSFAFVKDGFTASFGRDGKANLIMIYEKWDDAASDASIRAALENAQDSINH